MPLMMLRLSSGGRPRPRFPGFRSTGNKTLKIRRMRRIGVLTAGVDANDPDAQARNAVLMQTLEQLGWAEGHNLQVDYLCGQGLPDVIRKHAAELAALPPDVILAS